MDQEQMTLEDWLDDLCVRFILNLPGEDLGSIPHICFQIEEAHWFYEDFIRVLDPALPHMTLKDFCLRMFQHCPLFAGYSIEHHLRAYSEFMQYKTRIPVRGAIMLNHEMDHCVLVRGWKSNATWSFPRGKINKDESDLDCAVRECWEETGFDLRKAGLVPKEKDVKSFDITMRDQHLRMFVFRDVPMDTVFEPQTRNEIGKVAWYALRDLPAFRKKKGGKQNEGAAANNAIPNASKFYNVAPFLVPLKKWVLSQKKKDIPPEVLQDDAFMNNGDIEELEAAIPQFQEAASRSLAAEKEMRALLQAQKSGASRIPDGSNTQGAALLSMLKAKEAEVQPFQHQYPHTPMDHTITNPTQPQSPHYNHQTQRLPHGAFENPPQFPIAPHSNQMYNQSPRQYQARPQVHMTADARGYQNVVVSPRQYQTQPQLLHPQPQPPQVQQALLMRGMLATPGAPIPQQQQQAQQVPIQTGQHIAYQQQPQHAPIQGAQHIAYQQQQPNPYAVSDTPLASKQPVQPNAHSMGLLSMFKENGAQENVSQPVATSNSIRPTDQHRTGLLDMFKQEDKIQLQNFVKAPAPVPAAAARPELHLPFGALSIASRPKPGSETYGVKGNHGVSVADTSIARAPEASVLPPPNQLLKPRQDSSTEQKSQLLSLFGKNKGKESTSSPVFMERPRSRVASIASASGTNSSRRGSQTTPTSLTPADQSFLMNYLKNASKPQR